VACDVFGLKWMTRFYLCRRKSNSGSYSVLTHENETLIRIHQRLLAFYSEFTVDRSTILHWARKSKDNGGNLNPNDQSQSERPVSATHDFDRENFDERIQENRRISQKATAKELNIGLACVSEIISGFGYKHLGA
jgi:hypothetical protein